MRIFTHTFLISLLLASSVAQASVNIQNFEHTSSYGFENMSGARVLDSYVPIEDSYLLGIAYSYDRHPLVTENLDGTRRVRVLINNDQSLHLTAGYRLSDVLQFGFDTALIRTAFEDGGADTSFSDSRLTVNYTFYQHMNWAVGIQGLVTLPTGKGADYLSDSGVGEGLLLSLAKEWRPLSVNLNAGYLLSSDALDAVDPRLDYRRRLITEIGAIHPFNDRWSGLAEFRRQWTLPLNANLNPNEFYLGARDQWSESIALFAGASIGTLDQTTSNEWRLLAGLKWAPVVKKIAPVTSAAVPICSDVAPPDLKFTIHFENAKFSLDDKREISQMMDALENLKANIEVVDVIGHTSIIGSDAYNLRLSIRRAASIRSFLVREGESGDLIRAEGEGSKRLLDTSMNETAHSKNRRVEIIIRQKKSVKTCH